MPSDIARTTPDHASVDKLIEIDHVTFGYDPSRNILDDISMSFGRGQVTAILGGSGCGKTTVLRLIGGVHAVGKGHVKFDGQPIDTRNAAQLYNLRRRLGMLYMTWLSFSEVSTSMAG